MDRQRSHGGSLALPGVLLVLVGLYAYWTAERDLSSARPGHAHPDDVPPPVPSPGIATLHARPWDDPLSTCYAHWQREHRAAGAAAASIFTALSGQNQETPELTDTIQTLILNANEAGQPIDTLLMPVLLPGGPWAEDKEQRMRLRYAVLSALTETGFRLSFPDRLSYLVVPDVSVQVREDSDKTIPFLVPLKLYRWDDSGSGSSVRPTVPSDADPQRGRTERHYQVIVFWINESQLGARPLSTLQQIIQKIVDPTAGAARGRSQDVWRRLQIRMIGPASSDTLLSIAHDVNQRRTPYTQGHHDESNPEEPWLAMTIYSPRATAVRTPLEEHPVKFVHVIGSDQVLVEQLRDELRLRGAWPQAKGDGAIALITEQDTLYGRAIVGLFENALTGPPAASGSPAGPPGSSPAGTAEKPPSDRRLYEFRYFRGLDGLGAGTASGGRSGASSAPGGGRSSASTHDTVLAAATPRRPLEHRPEGPSQYDYLVRLKHELQRVDRQCPGGLTAVGVVGTDVYDKLLVIRALRPSLPRSVFFTTDLDAVLAHPDEYRSTHNLVVASHFGLRLCDELQSDIPPFRDGYQTATFLGTMLALGNPSAELANRVPDKDDPWGALGGPAKSRLGPLVFEISQRGPYQLTLTGTTSTASVHPPSPRQAGFPYGSLWLATAALAGSLVLVSRRNPGVNRRMSLLVGVLPAKLTARPRVREVLQCGLLGALVVSAAVLVTVLAGVSGRVEQFEPFDLIAGVSLWPAFLVRLAAICVAVVFLWSWYADRPQPAPLPAGLCPSDKAADLWRSGDGELPEELQTPEPRKLLRIALMYFVLVMLLAISLHAVDGFRGLAGHSLRGPGLLRLMDGTVRVLAQSLTALVIILIVLEHEYCRRFISRLAGSPDLELLSPVWAVREVMLRTKRVQQHIAWAIGLLLLVGVAHHPRLGYVHFSSRSLVLAGLGLSALLLWTALVRHAANQARRTCIETLLNRKLDLVAGSGPDGGGADPVGIASKTPVAAAVSSGGSRAGAAPVVHDAPAPSGAGRAASRPQLELLNAEIDWIQRVDEGAYQPWFAAPALGWLGGSAGVWIALDWALNVAQSSL